MRKLGLCGVRRGARRRCGPRTPARRSSGRTTRATGSSRRTRQTGCGWSTSPSCRPGHRVHRVHDRRVRPADRRLAHRDAPQHRPGAGHAGDGGHLPGPAGREGGGADHHSDAGSEYLSIRYGAELAAAGIGPSVGTAGDAYDNSIMERWIGSCGRELLDRILIWNLRHLMMVLREYEDFYNSHRPYRALDQAAPLRPLPDGVTNLDHFRVRRLDRAVGSSTNIAWWHRFRHPQVDVAVEGRLPHADRAGHLVQRPHPAPTRRRSPTRRRGPS